MVYATPTDWLCDGHEHPHQFPHFYDLSLEAMNFCKSLDVLTDSRLLVVAETPSWALHLVESTVRPRSSGRQNQIHHEVVVPSSLYIYHRALKIHTGWADFIFTHSVLRRQNPTFPMASDIVASSAVIMPSIVKLPPIAVRNFETAASVTSSFVWEDSIRDISVAKR